LRAEKGKAAHDQAASVSLEILLRDMAPLGEFDLLPTFHIAVLFS